MAACLDHFGRPRCLSCGLDLTSRKPSGRCPCCTAWYVAGDLRDLPRRYTMWSLRPRPADIGSTSRVGLDEGLGEICIRTAWFFGFVIFHGGLVVALLWIAAKGVVDVFTAGP